MLFLHPAFLWGLLAVALPVIIHLFNFRRYKTVYFSNVRFLQQLQIESKSQSQLRQYLVLALRSLFVAALVFCFAQPFIPNDTSSKSGQTKIVSVYVDNSFSMQNVGPEGPLLQVALQQARELALGLSTNTKFQLLTNDFEGKHQRLYTREDFLNLLEDVKISSAPRLFSEIVQRQRLFLREQTDASCSAYYLTDLQKSQFNFVALQPDTNIRSTFLPLLANKVNNLGLDSCWFKNPLQQKGFSQTLFARVKNYGEQKIDLGSAKLIINNQQLALASFSLLPNASTTVKFSFEANKDGENTGIVKLEDYPITFDDQFYFSFNSRSVIKVLLINGKESPSPNAFTQLFGNDSLFAAKVCDENAINFSAFKSSDVIVLNSVSEISSGLLAEVQNFSAKGGVLLIVPPVKQTPVSYAALLSANNLPAFQSIDTARLRADQIQYNAPFFADVFEKRDERANAPTVFKHYVLPRTAADAEVLMRLQNGDPFLLSSTQQQLSAFLLTSSLNDAGSNLYKHALFVPIIYKICFSSLGQRPLFYTTGKDEALAVEADSVTSDSPPHLIGKEQKLDVIPEVRYALGRRRLFTRGEVQLPGFYDLMQGTKTVYKAAFNYNRIESDLTCYSTEELKEVFEQKGWKHMRVLDAGLQSLSKAVAEDMEGKKLWKLFLILALGFLTLEVLVLRLLK